MKKKNKKMEQVTVEEFIKMQFYGNLFNHNKVGMFYSKELDKYLYIDRTIVGYGYVVVENDEFDISQGLFNKRDFVYLVDDPVTYH